MTSGLAEGWTRRLRERERAIGEEYARAAGRRMEMVGEVPGFEEFVERFVMIESDGSAAAQLRAPSAERRGETRVGPHDAGEVAATPAASPHPLPPLPFGNGRGGTGNGSVGEETRSGEDKAEPIPFRRPARRGAVAFRLYDYQRERVGVWESGESEIILKARQLGFSWLAAAYALWVAAYHESSHVAIFSKHVREMRKFMRKVRYIWKRLPDSMKAGGVPAIESFSFANESVISGFPSTEDSGVGETNALVIFDEWSMHPHGEAGLAAVLPTIAAGGQLIAMSTANPEMGPSGHFYEAWEAAVSGESGFGAVFVPWWVRPDRQTAEGEPSEAWRRRERRKYVGMSKEAFDAWYPACPEDAFQGREGLVYPQFSRERHVPEAPPVPWEETWTRRFATDYGGGDPTAVVVAGTWKRSGEGQSRIHVYGLMYRKEGAPTVEEIISFLGPWSRYSWAWGEGDPAPGGEVINASLRAAGFPCRRGFAARGEGIGVVANYLERGWLTFDAECEPLFREFGSYRWKPGTDPNSHEKYATKTPQDHHGDALDALRLLVMGVWRDEMASAGAFREVYSSVEL